MASYAWAIDSVVGGAEWLWVILAVAVVVVAVGGGGGAAAGGGGMVRMMMRKEEGQGRRRRIPLPPCPVGCVQLPYFGHLLQLLLFSGGLPHRWFHKLSRRHGHGPPPSSSSSSSFPFLLLWLGRVPVLVVSSSRAARLILRDHDLSFASRPSTSASRHLLYASSDLAFSPYGPYSRQVKELMMKNLFNVGRIPEYSHIRSQELARLVSSIAEATDSTTPQSAVRETVNETALDILCRMAFGKPVRHFGAAFMELTRETLELLGAFNVGDFLPAVRWLDLQGYERQIKQTHIKYDEILQRIIDDRRRELEANKGNGAIINAHKFTLFLDVLLLQHFDGGSSSKDDCIKAILVDLFGGAGTVSTSVEWALCELLRNKEIMEELRKELDNVLGKGQILQESCIPNLPFLQAVVKETLRLHPPVPLLNAHESSSPCEVDGYYVPAKTKTFVNAWAIARDESLWENPLDFLPQRFLNSSMDVKGQHYELLPFGAGRRICPAMN